MVTEADAHGGEREGQRDHITVLVNKKIVDMREEKVTGLEIKVAAIQQGVNIKPDYSLFLILKDESLQQIGDGEHIKLHKGEQFSATAPDDNS